MIPKIIHYCWFGRGEMPKLVKRCLKSWNKYCPGWKVVLWNEDTFDVNSTLWTKQAYEAKKYAFVADYVRLKALYEQGGVYLDSDVELIKPIDRFLVHDAFSGFECEKAAPTGIIASQAGQEVIKGWLDYYKDRPYLIDGKPNMEPNVSFMTADLQARGLRMDDSLQDIDGMVIYPQTWFCPLSIVEIETKFSDDTHTIHHFTSTWRTKKELKNFAKVRRHKTKWYRTLEYLRWLPNRVARKVFGDSAMDNLKKKLGK